MNPVQSDKNTPLTSFPFLQWSLWIQPIKTQPVPNTVRGWTDQLDEPCRTLLIYETRDSWSTKIHDLSRPTLCRTQNRLGCCVLDRCWELRISFMDQFRSQDWSHQVINLSSIFFHLYFGDIIITNICSCLALLLYYLTKHSMNLSNLHFNSVSAVISQLNVSLENKSQTKQPPSTPIFSLPVSVI